jgi:hypothetical protein
MFESRTDAIIDHESSHRPHPMSKAAPAVDNGVRSGFQDAAALRG